VTTLQYITHKEYGCCTTSELMALSKEDKPALEKLKEWAIQEMQKKGIEVG